MKKTAISLWILSVMYLVISARGCHLLAAWLMSFADSVKSRFL